MVEPLPENPVGSPDLGTHDRSEQAARFLDLTRQHGLTGEDPPELTPLIVAPPPGGTAQD